METSAKSKLQIESLRSDFNSKIKEEVSYYKVDSAKKRAVKQSNQIPLYTH